MELSDAYKRLTERRLALLADDSVGVSVYEVAADYRPNPASAGRYYVLARSAREAKTRFNGRFGWLRIFECKALPYGRAVRVVSDVEHNIII